MCSTHKLITAALVLWRVDHGQETLNQQIIYSASDLTEYAPFTSKHTGKPGVTIGELCEAAVTLSDGTASNLILRSVGGPTAWTTWVRSLGDSVTRLDRYEPEMDRVGPGDPRDTTTPIAMLRNVQKLVLGDVLSAASRKQFTEWLLACQTGGNRLHAGLPQDWREADKTGTGPAINNAANDVAVLWPPHRAPILVAAYYADSRESDDQRDAVLASVGRLVANSV
jgi:beta-lactamase class A